MSKRKIVIFGIGTTADIVFNEIKDDLDADIEVVAFCVDEAYYYKTLKYELPVVKFEEVEQIYSPKEYQMIIAISHQKLNTIRAEKCQQAENKGYILPGFIHSKADISSSSRKHIGKNSIIVNNVSIGPEVSIGNDVYIFSGAIISHHSVIEDNIWITPGTIICGKTVVGINTFIGANSIIGDHIKIGKNNFIGAGAVITNDTEDDSVYIVPNTPKYLLKSDQFIRMFYV